MASETGGRLRRVTQPLTPVSEHSTSQHRSPGLKGSHFNESTWRMNHFARLAPLASISIASLLVGCATEASKESRVLPKSIPPISVVIDCGECQVRPTVPELIRAGYAAAAAKAGVSITGDAQMTLTIKDYTERGLAMRSVSLVAGPLALALKDEIKAVALVDRKQLPLEFHYRIPFLGIETVAQKLGELSFDAVAKKLDWPSPSEENIR